MQVHKLNITAYIYILYIFIWVIPTIRCHFSLVTFYQKKLFFLQFYYFIGRRAF